MAAGTDNLDGKKSGFQADGRISIGIIDGATAFFRRQHGVFSGWGFNIRLVVLFSDSLFRKRADTRLINTSGGTGNGIMEFY